MGLKEIAGVRQYIDFDADGKIVRMYEISYKTEKTEGTFTFDMKADDYTASKAKKLAETKAKEIDQAVG